MAKNVRAPGITKYIRDLVQKGISDIDTVVPLVMENVPGAHRNSINAVLWEERKRKGIPPAGRANKGLFGKVKDLMSKRKFETLEELEKALGQENYPVKNLVTLKIYFTKFSQQ